MNTFEDMDVRWSYYSYGQHQYIKNVLTSADTVVNADISCNANLQHILFLTAGADYSN